MTEGCTFSGRKKGIINRTVLVKIYLALSDPFSSMWWNFFHQLDIDVKVSKLENIDPGMSQNRRLRANLRASRGKAMWNKHFPSVGLACTLC